MMIWLDVGKGGSESDLSTFEESWDRMDERKYFPAWQSMLWRLKSSGVGRLFSVVTDGPQPCLSRVPL